MNIQKDGNVQVPAILPRFRQLTDDGRKYYDTGDVDKLMIAFSVTTIDGVVLFGRQGNGKTAVFRQFMQRKDLQRLFGDTEVFFYEVYEDATASAKDTTEVLKDILNEKKGCSVVLYMKVSNDGKLTAVSEYCRKYLEEFKTAYNVANIKVILELTVEDSKQQVKKVTSCVGENFSTIPVKGPESFKDAVKCLKTMAQNISREYGNIRISDEVLMLANICFKGVCIDAYNLQLYHKQYEKLFAIAKSLNSKSVTKAVVKKLYAESFNKLAKTNYDRLRETAFHESGHTLFLFLMSQHGKLAYVTIIPGENYKGITTSIPEGDGSYAVRDREYYIMDMAGSIAGRAAESLLKDKPNPHGSAIQDLADCNEIAENMIYRLGFASPLGINRVYKKDKTMSEALLRALENEKAKVIKEATFVAEREVDKHRGFIEKLADLLLKKLFVTGDEARMLWEEHLMDLYKQNNS